MHDLDEAVRRFVAELEIGPWTAYRLAPPLLKQMRYHGEEVEFSLRHALAWQGELQFELVQPLEGPSIFADHLEAHGEGLHHVGRYVPDHPAAVAQALAAGFVELQSARGFGAEGDGAFAYFKRPGRAADRRADLGPPRPDRAGVRLPSKRWLSAKPRGRPARTAKR